MTDVIRTSNERLGVIKQTPRQASIDDIEWLCEEVERLRGEAEVADEQLAQLRGFAEAHKTCRGSDETCEQRAPVERALARRVYLKSERDMSGYRVVIGFDTLTDVQAAHQEVADIPKAPTQKAGESNSESSEMGQAFQGNDIQVEMPGMWDHGAILRR